MLCPKSEPPGRPQPAAVSMQPVRLKATSSLAIYPKLSVSVRQQLPIQYGLILRIGPTVAPALAPSRRCFPRLQTSAPTPDMALLETKCTSLRSKPRAQAQVPMDPRCRECTPHLDIKKCFNSMPRLGKPSFCP
ncbi:hypothetical protein B0H14DRAFT_2648041 [Mycena olivaceomarginata]|nr:hypothetical protein B0H14DRAFT_2648041 [Mycena olivaceomarginata]